HGRGLWITSVAALEEMTDTLLTEAVHLFQVPTTYQYRPRDTYPDWGSRPFVAPNPPRGAVITYYLREVQPDGVKLVIATAARDTEDYPETDRGPHSSLEGGCSMSRFLRLSLVGVFAFETLACYHATVDTGLKPSAQVVEKSFAAGWIFGLVPPSTVATASQCSHGAAKIETQLSFVNQLVAFLTLDIFTPMSIKVTCA